MITPRDLFAAIYLHKEIRNQPIDDNKDPEKVSRTNARVIERAFKFADNIIQYSMENPARRPEHS